MTNPYDSPHASPREPNVAPIWYTWFYKLYWPAWWIGTALIAGSWFGIVSSNVGWIGFGLAGAAAFGSYVLPSLAGVETEDFVILDSRLLKTKGDAYVNAIERFKDGASLMYDGVAFGFRPSNEIACGIVADNADLDDKAAMALANHAQAAFDTLKSESSEFRTAVVGRQFRISIMSGMDQFARELCRVVDGKLDWRR
ncbi:hypothetical protein [Rubripirellula reticaptiva]|uniref:Uncharacterized protein n=1 Tax=Rubripirellula reticaptiva TaxID=2528013 RepID=A0A5C6ETP4_9BACT|nr:hypothetical protein [Rubripirellula reticaptiva]TWU51457.1 hypothetical protein Poly59_30490 [Rubripirellula reticaptiva]